MVLYTVCIQLIQFNNVVRARSINKLGKQIYMQSNSTHFLYYSNKIYCMQPAFFTHAVILNSYFQLNWQKLNNKLSEEAVYK